jgi:hypothetical protein
LMATLPDLPLPKLYALLTWDQAYSNTSLTENMSSRTRKIKCDECKPHCTRCSSTGRRCNGYIWNYGNLSLL